MNTKGQGTLDAIVENGYHTLCLAIIILHYSLAVEIHMY